MVVIELSARGEGEIGPFFLESRIVAGITLDGDAHAFKDHWAAGIDAVGRAPCGTVALQTALHGGLVIAERLEGLADLIGGASVQAPQRVLRERFIFRGALVTADQAQISPYIVA